MIWRTNRKIALLVLLFFAGAILCWWRSASKDVQLGQGDSSSGEAAVNLSPKPTFVNTIAHDFSNTNQTNIAATGRLSVLNNNKQTEFGEILTKTREAMEPKNVYRANVKQIVFANTNGPGVEQEFEIHFDQVKKRFFTDAPITRPEGPSIQVTSNILPFLDKIQAWPKLTVSEKIYENRKVFRIDAESDHGLSSILLVDSEHFFVPRARLFIKGREFADTVYEYMNREGVWIPKTIVINYRTDGSRIVQQYSLQ